MDYAIVTGASRGLGAAKLIDEIAPEIRASNAGAISAINNAAPIRPYGVIGAMFPEGIAKAIDPDHDTYLEWKERGTLTDPSEAAARLLQLFRREEFESVAFFHVRDLG